MAYDFDTIANGYDRMNHLMTAGLDRTWRKKAVQSLGRKPLQVLDVACGTGDMMLALAASGHQPTGVDLSEEMMQVARAKGLTALMQADAERLPFADATFDAVTCAFGIRNFVHLDAGLAEMLRVLKPEGRMVILELSTPDAAIVQPFYHLYARRIIPLMGARLAGNREAYTYLPASIERFPKGDAFRQRVLALGASEVQQRKLTFGVCRMYLVRK